MHHSITVPMWRLLGAFWQLSFDCESNESCKQRMMKCVLYQGFVVILCVLSKTLAACNWGFAGLMISPQIYSSLAAMARVLQIWWERNRFQQKIKVGEIWTNRLQIISLVHICPHLPNLRMQFPSQTKKPGVPWRPNHPRLGSRCSPPSKVNQGLIGLERAQACALFTMPNVGQTFSWNVINT